MPLSLLRFLMAAVPCRARWGDRQFSINDTAIILSELALTFDLLSVLLC
jgi:hypothetical protein